MTNRKGGPCRGGIGSSFIRHARHHLRVPQRRQRLVDVKAVGRDDTTVMRLRDETDISATSPKRTPVHFAIPQGWARCGERLTS